MKHKICCKCKKSKTIEAFYKDKSTKDGLCKKCKECSQKYGKNYRVKNYDQIIKRERKYKADNKEQLKRRDRDYYRDNRSLVMGRKVEANRKRLKSNATFRLISNVRRSINKQLKKSDFSKENKSVLNYIGYSAEELRLHIEKQFEPWMNWNNRGSYSISNWKDSDQTTWKWQLDHIIPHSSFNYQNMECEEFRKCWALENLRPYSAKQNIMDGNRRNNTGK